MKKTPGGGDGVQAKKKGNERELRRPWRRPQEEIREEKNSTKDALKFSCQQSVHSAAIVFCYEADYLLDRLESPLTPDQESARHAVERLRMLATNGNLEEVVEKDSPTRNNKVADDDDNNDDGDDKDNQTSLEVISPLVEARKIAAQRLREIGLEQEMKAALVRSPPGKWPVMHEIVKGLWCGGWAALNDDCRVLKEKNITRVVSVISADQRKLPGQIVKSHLHVHVLDTLDASIIDHFPKICAFVESAKESEESVLVHCGAGISRAPTAVTACLMWRYRLPLQSALKLVKKARPSVRPNASFIRQLVEWEKHVETERGLIIDQQ